MRRDLVSAYAASGMRIASWFVISALLFRYRESHYAMFALVRATVGLLNYTALGLGPAMVRLTAAAQRHAEIDSRRAPLHGAEAPPRRVLDYEAHHPREAHPALRAYSNGVIVAAALAGAALIAVVAYATNAPRIHRTTQDWIGTDLPVVALAAGVGMILRLASDVPGAVLQACGRISRDNWVLVTGEVAWVLMSVTCISSDGAAGVAYAYAFSGALQFIVRLRFCAAILGGPTPIFALVDVPTIKWLIAFGSLVTLAQLADFLYAPTDFILINRLLRPVEDVAAYAPAVQIDAALLVLVGAISNVLLPRAALAHARGDARLVRQYYVRGTLVSLALLTTVAAIIWLLSPWIFRLWLGDPMPLTRAILPLVLIHTVLGGSSAVGRSILLGMGKVKPFAVAALVAGVANVIISYCFVKYLNLGLRGIIYGTICVVTVRCAIWMPWYVLRSIRSPSTPGQSESASAAPDPIVP
jgi:O-antigen/teichoic acid export membrane protein